MKLKVSATLFVAAILMIVVGGSVLRGIATYDARNATAASSNSVANYEAIHYTATPTLAEATSYYGFVTFGAGLNITENVFFNQGEFHLKGNLDFTSSGHVIYFSNSFTVKPADFTLWPGATITCSGDGTGEIYTVIDGVGPTLRLLGDLTIGSTPCQLSFYLAGGTGTNPGTFTIDACGNTLTIDSLGELVPRAYGSPTYGSLVIKNANFVLKKTRPFQFTSLRSNVTLQNVNVYLDPALGGAAVELLSYGAYGGSLTIKGKVTINGPGQTLTIASAQTTQPSGTSAVVCVEDNAELCINDGVTLQVSSDLAAKNEKIYLKTANSTLRLNNCTLDLPTAGLLYPGLQLERGTLILQNSVVVNNHQNLVWDAGLKLGDGASAANDVMCMVCSGARVAVSGVMDHQPA